VTIPLWCLLVGCLLPFVWSMATAPGRAALPEGIDNSNPRGQQARLQGLGARAVAAHANSWEALSIFTAAVLTAHVTEADPTWSAYLAVGWVVCRVLHGVVYLADIHLARSAAFMGALLCALGLFGLAATS